MGNYRHTSFGRMLAWIAAESGGNLTDKRHLAVRDANRVRQWAYSRYDELKLAVDVEECVATSAFSMDCNCQTQYLGISLPPEFIGAASVWVNGHSLQINSRWREYQDGMMRSCGSRLEATYAGVPAPAERDIAPWGTCSYLGLQSTNRSDDGKPATIQYLDANGATHIDEITLKSGQYIQTSVEVKAIAQPAGVTLPIDLAGGVILAQLDTGRILSEYKPWEHKPAYRRLSIPGICCGDSVLVRGTRAYRDLYWDHETAEIDNELAVLAIYRFLKHSSSQSPTDGHQQLAKFHEAEAMRYLSGDKNREDGASTVRRFSHSRGAPRRGGLFTRG